MYQLTLRRVVAAFLLLSILMGVLFGYLVLFDDPVVDPPEVSPQPTENSFIAGWSDIIKNWNNPKQQGRWTPTPQGAWTPVPTGGTWTPIPQGAWTPVPTGGTWTPVPTGGTWTPVPTWAVTPPAPTLPWNPTATPTRTNIEIILTKIAEKTPVVFMTETPVASETPVVTETPVVSVTETPIASETPQYPPIRIPFGLGGQTNDFSNPDLMKNSGMTWVKRQIKWRPGDDSNHARRIIEEAHARGFKILLGITGAGLSSIDYESYTNYLGEVAKLGPNAIEVWNEENLDIEWPQGEISPTTYVNSMLKPAYQKIKSANQNVMVISGAPAPTGYFGGGCSSIGCDDKPYIEAMAKAGAAQYLDCVGVHYNEGIVSPSDISGDPRGNSDHHTRYYSKMIQVYRNAFGGTRPLCFTELGYLSGEGWGGVPNNFSWAKDTSIQRQSELLGQVVNLARYDPRIQLLIIFNVDFTMFDMNGDPQAGYAMIRRNGSCPACDAIAAAMGKGPTETTATPPPPPPPPPTSSEPCADPVYPPTNEYPLVGLHASADPVISVAERCTFQALRPSVIKVLTHHPPEDIALLARSQPQASWVVRVQFKFENRFMDGNKFAHATIEDTRRTLKAIGDRPVIIELYNEPNISLEGFLHQWQNGTEFQEWWLTALERFRAAFPNVPIIYPGLSPGGDVNGIRQGHTTFIEQSRQSVDSADGLAVHLYWSNIYSLDSALAVLDDYISRFPGKPIWITETSYNVNGISDKERARQYLALIDAVKLRPAVRGVIFFVASASDPTFAHETWVGKNIAPIIGRRDQR